MRILAIETSCDETAVAIVDAQGDERRSELRVLGNALMSQINIHREFGGVFPALAKREHAKNLVPLLEAALEEAELLHEGRQALSEVARAKISEILARESELAERFFEFISECEVPEIDAIAVTSGPGLEPALWVGIQFAKTLALVWNKPLLPINHMEGHILSGLASQQGDALLLEGIRLPALALLISGGHTELVLMRTWLEYELIGETRDDAVGEAFDKVARMLGLPYPGGPEISKLAEQARTSDVLASLGGPASKSVDISRLNLDIDGSKFALPRPMIHEASCDFSFAGLKTAVLYSLKKHPDISETDKTEISLEFENAVSEVLWAKTARAIEQTDAQTLVLGGGVSNNTHIRRVFTKEIAEKYSNVELRLPAPELTTDNAVMIALAGFYRALRNDFVDGTTIRANGNQRLA
jgi:N6-L-threonylcarbamoyladenine synthase